jgi:tetratricopeptide (TPR) repeat protein
MRCFRAPTSPVQPLDGDFLNSAALDRAYELASKAVQLNPNLPQAHASLGNVLRIKHERDAAIATFDRATALNPNYSDWRYAVPLIFFGQFLESNRQFAVCRGPRAAARAATTPLC